jgi:hypothetical protein
MISIVLGSSFVMEENYPYQIIGEVYFSSAILKSENDGGFIVQA